MMRKLVSILGVIAIMLATACGGDPVAVGSEEPADNVVTNFSMTLTYKGVNYRQLAARLTLSPNGRYTLSGEVWRQKGECTTTSCLYGFVKEIDESGSYTIDLDRGQLRLGSTSAAFHPPHVKVVWAFGGDLGTLELTR